MTRPVTSTGLFLHEEEVTNNAIDNHKIFFSSYKACIASLSQTIKYFKRVLFACLSNYIIKKNY